MRRLTWSEAVTVREKLYVNHVNELQNYNRIIIIKKKPRHLSESIPKD